MAIVTRDCAACSERFTASNPTAKYCSNRCRQRAKYLPGGTYHRNPIQCARCGKETPRYPGAVQGKTRCPDCRRNSGKKCSTSECAREAVNRGMCKKHYAAWLYRQPPKSDAERCVVEGCTRRRMTKGMCAAHRSTAYRKEQSEQGNPRSRSEKWLAITCEYCGADKEVRSHTAKVQRYCSLLCHARANNSDLTHEEWQSVGEDHVKQRRRRNGLNRRARLRRAYVANVDPGAVFKLDGYRCYLCGKRCKPQAPNNDPRQPTVDHVIPLARGGTHEPSNVRLACRKCNSRKSASGAGGEQFALPLGF